MCYQDDATLLKGVSFGDFVDWTLTVVTVALLILVLTGCMRLSLGQGAKLEVKAESGSTVMIGNKSVSVPLTATIPASSFGQ